MTKQLVLFALHTTTTTTTLRTFCSRSCGVDSHFYLSICLYVYLSNYILSQVHRSATIHNTGIKLPNLETDKRVSMLKVFIYFISYPFYLRSVTQSHCLNFNTNNGSTQTYGLCDSKRLPQPMNECLQAAASEATQACY